MVPIFIVLILWAAGVFKKKKKKRRRRRPPGTVPTEKILFNTYMLNPNDIWTYWDETGSKIWGTNIQALVRNIFAKQNDKQTAEYGYRRVLIFLLPGEYVNFHIKVGYYTSVVGLGETAADTVVRGSIEVSNDDHPCIGALDNNYRNISNLTIEVDKTTMIPEGESQTQLEQDLHSNYFRVSKGSPIRNIIIARADEMRANFALSELTGGCGSEGLTGGYASGGFMSNVLLEDGHVRYGAQHQFFSRNCQFDFRAGLLEQFPAGGEEIAVWNIYLLGCISEAIKTADSQRGDTVSSHNLEQNEIEELHRSTTINKCPSNDAVGMDWIADPPFVLVKDTTPGLMASIPQIRYNQDTATFSIIKPSLVNNSSGLITTAGEQLSNVFIVVSTTSIKTINKKLNDGVNLIFSPLLYYFDEPVRITRTGTVVMTLGYATIITTGSNPAIVIDSAAEGVRLSGFLLQAGKKNTKSLLLVGNQPRRGGAASNPTIIYDIILRVGTGEKELGFHFTDFEKIGACETMVVVNQHYTVLDNIWCWRAPTPPLGSEGGFSEVDHGIVVTGDRVRMFGVCVEHTLKEQIIWEGAHGELYFQVLTLPPDVFGDWMFPGIRVTGKNFKGSGLGVYASFETTYTKDRKNEAPQVPTGILTYKADDDDVLDSAEIESAFTIFVDTPDSDPDPDGSIDSVFNGRGPKSDASNMFHPQWCGTLCDDVNKCDCSIPYTKWCNAI